MCLTCTASWCYCCAVRAVWLVVANGKTKVVVKQACRRHVDHAREDAAREAGVRPNIIEIPHQRTASNG